MNSPDQRFLEQVLDAVEERETALLVWGVVDGYFTSLELAELINPRLDEYLDSEGETYFNVASVVESLVRLVWLVEVETADRQIGYRSRMSETVRLMLRLRQLFPKHSRTDTGWQNAATLVADFRFQRRRRQYPKRGTTLDHTLASIASSTEDPAIAKAVRAQLTASKDLMRSGLAEFQVRAAQRILQSLESSKPLSTIVSAGTGSGKTLAFYLPALASIARHLIVSPSDPAWVKVVAIYPRAELLKDQLREVMSRTAELDRAMAGACRKIRIAALFADTPRSTKHCNWRRVGEDRICPMLRCVRCGGELRWKAANFNADREQLTCATTGCGFETDAAAFPLTRERIAQEPPDILFTTTESLNRRLSDNRYAHLFGVTPAFRAPDLVLLDEAHTYEGKHGAQVAYLMRRWQSLTQQTLRFVGLSATLREAAPFFATLTGIYPSLVAEISPKAHELVSEGAEYLVALRGDPVSRGSLLSTTIQTAMLIERCLDPRVTALQRPISDGVFGQRTFAFTDDLDVTNRLFFNLLDAEGRDSFGNPNMRAAPAGGLAVLRRQGLSRLRYFGGQDWRLSERLGHRLSNRLVVARVSSQDRGIDNSADVVVATAALEVGFDDPTVGAVVQHKAPRGTAGYLQRKGRAGRIRGMRPWMIIVLSDYGRDRVAYQNYDLLFDPELPVRALPLSNRYIRRMQATYCLIDFLGESLQSGAAGSVWDDLAKPPWNHSRRARLIAQLKAILQSDAALQRFLAYTARALRLSEGEVEALLWEYPRPLVTTVIPTALRRLATNWRAGGVEGIDFQVAYNPLPDFVPASLFSDLNLTEVQINLPQRAAAAKDGAPQMSLFAALKEFAPGRVSRRFGVGHGSERYWMVPDGPLPADGQRGTIDVDVVGRTIEVGIFGYSADGQDTHVPVCRPVEVTPSKPPTNVGDTSNARLIWHSQLVTLGEGTWLLTNSDRGSSTPIFSLGFFLHATHAPVEVRRFAVGSKAEITTGKGERRRVEYSFAKGDLATALGTAFSADGVAFCVTIPKNLSGNEGGEAKWRALRTARFFDDAWRGKTLSTIPSAFVREWLAQIELSAITYEAMRSGRTVEQSAAAIENGEAEVDLLEVLAVLFQSQFVNADDEDVSLRGDDRLKRELETLLHDSDVRAEMKRAAECLWEPIGNDWEPWLEDVYLATMASAILRAITDLCPTLDPNDLVVDIGRGAGAVEDRDSIDPLRREIWITEQNPGGCGLIEEFMRSYSEDPRRFLSVTRAALGESDFELIDQQLVRVLSFLTTDEAETATKRAILEIRAARSHKDLSRGVTELRKAMVRDGIAPFHGLMVSLSNRLLRPGAGPAMDVYVSRCVDAWEAQQSRLGIEIDLRIACYWLSQSADIEAVVGDLGMPGGDERGSWRMSAIYGLLWPRGRAIRHASLELYSPFVEHPCIERLLVAGSWGTERTSISVEDSDWFSVAANLLGAGALVTLKSQAADAESLSSAIETLLCNPIDTGYLRAYPRLQGVRHSATEVAADFELVEALQ